MKKELITQMDPKSPISEVFRTLRANIQFMNTKRSSRLILVTSTVPGEGKSWISSNLAVTFAQAGKTVLLIDSDMRKGRQYVIFDVPPKPGLSNYLSGIGMEDTENVNDIENYIQETEIDNLYVMPAGDIPPNPSELLISAKMNRLLKELSEKCDIVIIDGTPCELVTDSMVLTRMVDSTIVVTAYKQTKKDSLRKIVNNIKDVGGKNIGVVFNKIPISSKKYDETYYYGSCNKKHKSNSNYEHNTEFLDTTLSKEKEEKIQEQLNEIKNNKQVLNKTTKKTLDTEKIAENKKINNVKNSEIDEDERIKDNKEIGTKINKTNINNRNRKSDVEKMDLEERKPNIKIEIENKREMTSERDEEILKRVSEFMEKQQREKGK